MQAGLPNGSEGKEGLPPGAAAHPSRGHPEMGAGGPGQPLQRTQVVIVRSVKSARDPAGGGSCGLCPLVQKQDADSHPGQVAGLRLDHNKEALRWAGETVAWEPAGNSDRGLVGCLQGNPQKPGDKMWPGNLSCSGSRPQTRLGPGTWGGAMNPQQGFLCSLTFCF